MTTFNDTVIAPAFQTTGGKATLTGDNGGRLRLFHPVDAKPHIELIANETTPENTGGGLLNVADGGGDRTIQLNGQAGAIVIGIATPDRPLTIQAQGDSQELISFKDSSGATKWHINQDLGGSNPGLNFVETDVADGRLFLRAGGNVGIGTPQPVTSLHVEGNLTLDSGDSPVLFTGTGNAEHNRYLNLINSPEPNFRSASGLKAGGVLVADSFDFANPGKNDLIVKGSVGVGGGVRVDGILTAASATISGQVPAGPGSIILDGDINGANLFIANGRHGIVQLSSVPGAPDKGAVFVTDVAGSAGGITAKAGMFVDDNGRGVVMADVKNFRTRHPAQPDMDIVYACVEGPEAAVYVRGSAHLVEGQAVISLPDHFASVASAEGMTVQLTPLSANSLGLAVVTKRVSGIEVTELHQGVGTYDFDWEVKAVRKGYEGYRVTRPRLTGKACEERNRGV
jgi:hypothetical protein